MDTTAPTPSTVLYSDLKNFARISNRDAALTLLSPTAFYGGLSIRDRANSDRTFLSREIVHARPGQLRLEHFSNLAKATQELEATIVERRGGGDVAYEELGDHYLGSAAKAMCKAVAHAGFDANLYVNAFQKASLVGNLPEKAHARLYLMLFVITGCLGDPRMSINIVNEYATNTFSYGLYTTETSVGPGYAEAITAPPQNVRLGLLRIVNGVGQLPVQPLSCEPEGTIVGALASGPHDITNVGYDVSRHHLRIYRSGGSWWVQGLNSTNGTTLISGDTRTTYVVEPPKSQREPGKTYGPLRLSNSDTLCLGSTTQFLVMCVADDEQ